MTGHYYVSNGKAYRVGLGFIQSPHGLNYKAAEKFTEGDVCRSVMKRWVRALKGDVAAKKRDRGRECWGRRSRLRLKFNSNEQLDNLPKEQQLRE